MNRTNLKKGTYFGYFIGSLAYLSVITREQIFSDEYDLLGSGEDLSKHLIKDGRPIGATIYRFMAFLVDSPSDILYLRILSLAASLLLLLLISNEISKTYNDDFFKILISIALFLPAFALYITWGMLSYFMIASLASFIAFKLWVLPSRRSRVVAFFIQIIVLLVYPPAAFASFAFMGVIALISKASLITEIKRTWDWVVLNFTAGLSAIAIVILDSNLRGYTLNSRVQIVNAGDALEKVIWLFSRPLIISTRLFDIRSPNTLTALVTFLLFSLVFLLGFNRHHVVKKLLFCRVILFVACLSLSLAPIALSADNQFDYRLILGTSISLYIAFVFAVLQVVGRFSKSAASKFLMLIIFLVVGVVTMYSHSTKLFVDPYVIKKQLIYNSINHCFVTNVHPSSIVLVGRELIYAQRENLGLFSMQTDMASEWVPIPSFKLALSEMNLSDVPVLWADPNSMIRPDECRIDLSKFVKTFSN